MPVYRNFEIELNMEYLLHRQGYGSCPEPRQQVRSTLNELLANLDEEDILKPVIACEYYKTAKAEKDGLRQENGEVFQISFPPAGLSSIREIAVVACTIGPDLEKKSAELFERKEPLRGLLLDGLGNLALDSVVLKACRMAEKKALLNGWHVSGPRYPGSPGFPLTEQFRLFKMLPSEDTGVRLTSSGFIYPRKSVSMVICAGPGLFQADQSPVCGECNKPGKCNYSYAAL